MQALKELVRVVRPGGEILVYVWAKEQEETSKRKFQSQDVIVPWNLPPQYHEDVPKEEAEAQQGGNNNGKHVVVDRYCHVFAKGELETMWKSFPVQIIDSYFDTSNWCTLVRKLE